MAYPAHLTAAWLCGLLALLSVGCDSSPVARRSSSTSQPNASDSTSANKTLSPSSGEQTTQATIGPADKPSTLALEAANAKLTRDVKGEVIAADLRGCKIDDIVLGEIATLTTLQQLDMRECVLTNAQFTTAVKPLAKLRALRLSGKGAATTVDDEGLSVLAGCPDLRVLAADELWFSEVGLNKISGCKNLSELYIAQTLIEDAAMPTVASFKQLKKLRLAKTQISVEGLKALAGLKLEDLDLSECSAISVATCRSLFILKCVAPIQALMLPNGCSTVERRTIIASGLLSSRACTRSRTSSRSHRLTRRSLPVVQSLLRGHASHALVQ